MVGLTESTVGLTQTLLSWAPLTITSKWESIRSSENNTDFPLNIITNSSTLPWHVLHTLLLCTSTDMFLTVTGNSEILKSSCFFLSGIET